MTSAPQTPPHSSAPQSPPHVTSPQSPAHTTSTVPAPPQGPGVVVPFAAPPRDPDKSRLAVGIIVGVTAFLLVCGGAVAATFGVLVWSSNELAAQSAQTVDDFLNDIEDEKYGRAYESLCESAHDRLTRQEFTQVWSELGVVDSQTVGTGSSQQDLVVRAELTLSDGTVQEIELTVVLSQKNMTMSVCGWDAVQ